MKRALVVAIVVGAGLAVAGVPGMPRRGRAPVAAATTAQPARGATPTGEGASLEAMLAVGRRVRLQRFAPPAPAAARRRAIVEAIDHGAPDARRVALKSLALADRPAAEALARARLDDRVLFADAARLLLIRAGGPPDAADLTRVRKALRTGDHDEASRAAVSALVLETLVRLDSPAAPTFAATLAQSPSGRVRAVAARRGSGRHAAGDR